MKLLPYEQGYLDGLCGVYSVINATRLLVKGMQDGEAMQLFSKCMKHVEKRKSLGRVSTKGVNEKDMWSILNHLIAVDYGINVKRPFPKAKKLPSSEFFKELWEYLRQDGKRTAIIGIECEDWDHWTVIRSLTQRRISLFDSASMTTINIAQCSVDERTTDKRYRFISRKTFFLSSK